MTYKLHKVGSDAELFLTRDNNPWPVCGLVGGTKEAPLPVLGGNGFAIQEDNVLLEFNIPPAAGADEFQQSIMKMLEYLKTEMSKSGLCVVPQSSMVFDSSQLQSEQAKKFGCEPDFCVWTRSVNEPPQERYLALVKDRNGRNLREIRSSGYHIHVSYEVDGETPEIPQIEDFVKAQDLFLGVPSVYLEDSAGPRRRNLYGRAGCFRLKPYGHEYRVLGGSLISFNPQIHEWIFRQVERSVTFLNNYADLIPSFWKEYGKYIIDAINSSNSNSFNVLQAACPMSLELPPGVDLESLKRADVSIKKPGLSNFGPPVWSPNLANIQMDDSVDAVISTNPHD